MTEVYQVTDLFSYSSVNCTRNNMLGFSEEIQAFAVVNNRQEQLFVSRNDRMVHLVSIFLVFKYFDTCIKIKHQGHLWKKKSYHY